MNATVNLSAFAILTGSWVCFGAALLLNRALLDRAWKVFRGLPWPVQIVVALLVLPVLVGLWIWETRWPAALRLVLVVGLAWITVYTFFPQI